MRVTKFGHACVKLEKDGRRIVIDPGTMTPEAEAIAGVEAILVTHEHWDHFDAGRVRAALAADPDLAVYTCRGVERQLAGHGGRVHVVDAGQTYEVAGFRLTIVGRAHHVGHPDVVPVDNVGFLVDDAVFHPGDALTVTTADTLLVPGQAPWMSVGDLVRYIRAVRPKRAYAIHDGLLNEQGLKVLDATLERESQTLGADIRRLGSGVSVDV